MKHNHDLIKVESIWINFYKNNATDMTCRQMYMFDIDSFIQK